MAFRSLTILEAEKMKQLLSSLSHLFHLTVTPLKTKNYLIYLHVPGIEPSAWYIVGAH